MRSVRSFSNAWFVNFNGIGNGCIIVPLLQCFEKAYSSIKYYHTENIFLQDSWFQTRAQLKNLKGFSPLVWRKFQKIYWKNIISFINQNQIDLIINLRNEGPKYDVDYYRFKEKYSYVVYWDLDFNKIQKRKRQQNLTQDIIKLFESKAIDMSYYNPFWLNKFCRKNRKNIGFGLAASQQNKRWPEEKWVRLGKLLSKEPHRKIILFPGESQDEIDQAMNIKKELQSMVTVSFFTDNLKNITKKIGNLACFVSNDTGMLHISAAIGIYTIGLYTNTDPSVWSPYNKKNFFIFENKFMKKCSHRKNYCGNCLHYYSVCPAMKKFGDDINPKQVAKSIEIILSS